MVIVEQAEEDLEMEKNKAKITEIAEIEQRISLANKSCSREAVSSSLSDKR